MVDIPVTAFQPVSGGPPNTKVVQLNTPQGIAPQTLKPVTFVNDIQTAVTDNDSPGGPALPPPNNFHFTDLTVGVSGDVTGDTFKGATTGITAQFVDLTPDNLLISALTPNAFMRSDTGNDLLLANGGRNILSGGSGNNVFLGASGHDTFLGDARTASTTALGLNFTSGDDLAVIGLNVTDFKFSANDALSGLEIDALPNGANTKVAASIVLPGYSVNDIGTKLSLGISTTADNTSFLFVHAN